MSQRRGRKTDGGKDAEFWESLRLNDATYIQYYNRLTELATVMFEWTGLPESVDPRYLELTLFSEGRAVFYKDDALNQYVALRTVGGTKLNVYGVPQDRSAIGENGYRCDGLTSENSVIIYNNYLHTNSRLDVEMFSLRLSDIDRSIDVNVKAQKTPVLIQCTEEERLTLRNLYKQYVGNMPFIFGTNNIDVNALKVLTTNAPYVADKLTQQKTQIWNEILTYLGISNISIVKKERLISDEALRAQGGTIASRYSRLETRRLAAQEINKVFPELHVDVDFREDYREATLEKMYSGESGDGGIDIISNDKGGAK